MSHFSLLDIYIYTCIFLSWMVSFLISAIFLGISYVVAVQSPDSEKTSAYECGFEPFQDARNKFEVRFYIIAILFLLFDLELTFLFPWAASITYTGANGYLMAIIFIFILIIGLIYETIKGALNSR